MYQLRAAIVKRREADHRKHAALVTAQTRHLYAATMAAAGDEGASERAMRIDLVPRQKAEQPKPVVHAATVDAAIAAFGQPEWGVQPDG